MKNKKLLFAVVIVFLMSTLNMSAFAASEDLSRYSADDITAVNNIIDNNGLQGYEKDAPEAWAKSGLVFWKTGGDGKRYVQNLTLDKNQLNGTLDVSGMSELKYLKCGNNNLTGLNVSGLTNIEIIQCANNKLTSIDISGLTTLETLQCYNNLLTTIDLTGLTNLKDFRCHLNSNLTEINGLSDCTNLELLLCAQCDLQGTLDVTNLEKLTRLACYTNKITTLVGLENKADMKELEVYTNNLQQLDVSGCQKLEKFWCNNNELSIINGLADCTALKSFKGDRNNLTALDLSGVPDKCDLTYYNNRGFTENNCFTEVTLGTGTLKIENGVGGKGYISEIVLADNKVSLATKPETGYVFEGWYTDASLTDESKIDFDGNVSGATTLYPKFSSIISNVIISNLPANITYGDNIELKILEINVASGYDAANATYKWYEGEDDFDADSSNYTYTVNDTNEHTISCDITLGGYKVTKTFTFTASPKMINTEISLAAPVKNAVPQTDIETDEYTATVVWSPEVTSTFAKSTDYTATITITPKVNYTTNGIAQNGYTVSGAVTVENDENSNVVTAVFPRTSGSSSGGGGTTRYTISFETNGGSRVASRQVIRNTVMKEPTAPTKDGFDFAGWYTDKELKTKYDFTSNVTMSITLYAKWAEKDNSANQIVLTIGEKSAHVFGQIKTNDVAPKIVNGRTMLPARFVAESLGAVVKWDGDKQLVTITGKNLETNEDVIILITIGAENAVVNGENVKLDSPAFIENDRTYTPVRFISEQLGASVEWMENEQKVVITKTLSAEN